MVELDEAARPKRRYGTYHTGPYSREILVNEENDDGRDDRPFDPEAERSFLAEVARGLKGSGAVAFARELTPKMQGIVGAWAGAEYSALIAIYGVGWAIRRSGRHRHGAVLLGLGAKPKGRKIFLPLLNAFWPAPAEGSRRKVTQTRHSRHAQALEEAYALSVAPEKLRDLLTSAGGIAGLAELARIRGFKEAQSDWEDDEEGGSSSQAGARDIAPSRASGPRRGSRGATSRGGTGGHALAEKSEPSSRGRQSERPKSRRRTAGGDLNFSRDDLMPKLIIDADMRQEIAGKAGRYAASVVLGEGGAGIDIKLECLGPLLPQLDDFDPAHFADFIRNYTPD